MKPTLSILHQAIETDDLFLNIFKVVGFIFDKYYPLPPK